MTVRQDTGPISSGAGGDGRTRPEAVAQDTREGASNVVAAAGEGVRDVAEEVGQQAKAVASEAKRQLDQVVNQGRDEVRQQLDQRNTQAAEQLRTLSRQFRALAEGNTSEAGPLLGYLSDAQSHVQRLATRLEMGGPQGVIDDITRFARRRPGMFLVSALGAGFLAGRVVRAAAAVRQDGDDDGDHGIGSSMTNAPAVVVTPDQDPMFSSGASTTPGALGAAP